MELLLQKGIYAIKPTLESVYVGHTEANFLIRFLEHLIAIERYTNHFLKHSLKPKASPAELLHVTPSYATQLSFFK